MLPRFVLCLVLGTVSLAAQDPFRIRLELERLRMPATGERLGQLFVALERGADRGPYWGPVLWGAVEGRRGGHIGIGLEGGWRMPLGRHLVAGAGLSLTAGGGANVDTGGGFAYRPHLDLRGRWGATEAGLTWSRMRFPSGAVASSQLGFTLARTFPGPDLWLGFGLGVSKEQRLELLVQQWSHPEGLLQTDRSRAQGRPGFLGAAWSQQGEGVAYLSFEANAAASGGHAGYMDLLAGAGLELASTGPWRLRGALLAGPAGGGGLELGGGLLLKASLGLALRAGAQEWTLEGAALRAPGSGFTAHSMGLRTGRVFGAPRAGAAGPWCFTFGWQALSRTQRGEAGGEAPGIGLIQLGGSQALGEHVYVGCHTGFAASGGAGSYATGALGAGLRTGLLAGRHRLLAELRVGAGGGAGLDTRGGALLQPMVGWRWALEGAKGLQLMGGRVKGLKGRLDSPVLELACVLGAL